MPPDGRSGSASASAPSWTCSIAACSLLPAVAPLRRSIQPTSSDALRVPSDPVAFKTNPLAQQLNERLEQVAPSVLAMLSPLGRRLYFPKGILSQIGGGEAEGQALQRDDRHRHREGRPDVPALDAAARRRDRAERRLQLRAARRPSDAARALAREARSPRTRRCAGKSFGMPIATSALTHGLAVAGDLFVGEGDRILLPGPALGQLSTHLRSPTRRGDRDLSRSTTSRRFHVRRPSRPRGRTARERDKLIVLLNFPNNPTGYMPTPSRGRGDRGRTRRAGGDGHEASSRSRTTPTSGSSTTSVASR